jgi:hypothetical protein
MANQISLDRLRDLIRQNQQSGEVKPSAQNQKIFVDREGKIVEGNQRSSQPLSEVQQDVFYSTRLQQDRATVLQYLPANTKEYVTSEGVRGWVYEFRCEFGDLYTMFIWYDGASYQVLVLAPEFEKYWRSPHTGHIFEDGRICFGKQYANGRLTLQDAYAKSVLWANGVSAALHGNMNFPFSYDAG